MSTKNAYYDLLIRAIIEQAVRDLHSSNKVIREDARGFIRSSWFTTLTGVNGRDVLKKYGY